MTKEEEEAKAAADKAAADAKAAADKAAAGGGGGGGPTPEERKAADDKRVADEKALADKIAAVDNRTVELDAKIKKMREQQEADAKKGKDTKDLEARLADAERRLVDTDKTLLELHEREKSLIDRANQKTLETDIRKALDGKVDPGAMGDAVDLLILRGRARVDADGKVSIIDEKGQWGSITPEAVLRHVPNALQLAKGVAGSGSRGPNGEVKVDNDSWKTSQADFNRLSKEGKLPTGNGRNPVPS